MPAPNNHLRHAVQAMVDGYAIKQPPGWRTQLTREVLLMLAVQRNDAAREALALYRSHPESCPARGQLADFIHQQHTTAETLYAAAPKPPLCAPHAAEQRAADTDPLTVTQADLTSLTRLLVHGATTRAIYALMRYGWSSVGQIQRAHEQWKQTATSTGTFAKYLDMTNLGRISAQELVESIQAWQDGEFVLRPAKSDSAPAALEFLHAVRSGEIKHASLVPSSHLFAAQNGLTSDAGSSLYMRLANAGFLGYNRSGQRVALNCDVPYTLKYSSKFTAGQIEIMRFPAEFLATSPYAAHQARYGSLAAASISDAGVEGIDLDHAERLITVTKFNFGDFLWSLNPEKERYTPPLRPVLRSTHQRDCPSCRTAATEGQTIDSCQWKAAWKLDYQQLSTLELPENPRDPISFPEPTRNSTDSAS